MAYRNRKKQKKHVRQLHLSDGSRRAKNAREKTKRERRNPFESADAELKRLARELGFT